MTDDELTGLRSQVQYLTDRLAILDCVSSLSRGHDRHDSDLLTQGYHEDGWDEHGIAVNPGPEYAAWANATHSSGSQATMHHITTHTCEIDGDQAHAESYVLGTVLNHDGVTVRVLSGRYVDRLEKRDGTWRVAVRRSTLDLAFVADAGILEAPAFRAHHYPQGSRDRQDLSYQRPLQIDTPAPALW